MRQSFFIIFLTVCLLPLAPIAQTSQSGKNTLTIRGRQVDIYFYAANKDSGEAKGKILYTPGNAGMKRMAVTMAQTMASWGYEVYGLDVKKYLERFTGDNVKLKATDVMADYRDVAKWMTNGKAEPVMLVGWSQGAGMNLLAGAPAENKKIFSGMICIGLGPESLLGWKFSDEFADALKKMPNEPKFRSEDYLPQIAPLPLYVIQSNQDEWVTAEQAKRLFALAPQPKKFILIEATDHHFKDNVNDFYQALREGLQWIRQPSN